MAQQSTLLIYMSSPKDFIQIYSMKNENRLHHYQIIPQLQYLAYNPILLNKWFKSTKNLASTILLPYKLSNIT